MIEIMGVRLKINPAGDDKPWPDELLLAHESGETWRDDTREVWLLHWRGGAEAELRKAVPLRLSRFVAKALAAEALYGPWDRRGPDMYEIFDTPEELIGALKWMANGAMDGAGTMAAVFGVDDENGDVPDRVNARLGEFCKAWDLDTADNDLHYASWEELLAG